MNQNYLRQLLRDWGEWVDRAAVHTGYPTSSSIVSAKEALRTHVSLKWQLPGGGSYRYALPNRHAILCFDMPTRLASVHQAILKLPEESKAVLTLWYAHSLKVLPEDPRHDVRPIIWHRKEKAAFVGMSYGVLQRQVSRARSMIAQTIEKNVASVSEKVIERRKVG